MIRGGTSEADGRSAVAGNSLIHVCSMAGDEAHEKKPGRGVTAFAEETI
ncbi:hypothetical protein SAMN06265374_2987 [Roseibium denhamense]|uniref:Uncharacterized protein n=1 Tax=Roseibium denhamense TaxID=76305 RepID=A0ABY1P883_9HYPH|nr:hypothetical protein SAMN06265374_2987 [Roseibium denhamense]